jgi:hypothetical protein
LTPRQLRLIERPPPEAGFPRAGSRQDGRSALAGYGFEGPGYSFEVSDHISDEAWAEAARALCKFVICGRPQTPKHRRAVAVRAALMNLCEGSDSGRAKQLERKYRAYLRAGWKRELGLDQLPEPRSVECTLLHRMARLGCASSWSQLLRISGPL